MWSLYLSLYCVVNFVIDCIPYSCLTLYLSYTLYHFYLSCPNPAQSFTDERNVICDDYIFRRKSVSINAHTVKRTL